jgi:PAS domain S-box-containing protein
MTSDDQRFASDLSHDQLLREGGEMGARVRAYDWSKTPLGAIDTWSQGLRTAVGICLLSRFPILLWWGADFIKIYNDAYRPILGTKHPDALGRSGRDVWAEIWHIIGPMLETVYQDGRSTWSYDQMLPMDRHGFTEETYFTFSYSPILDEQGSVSGIFTAVSETTKRVLGERRLKTLHDLGEGANRAKTAEEACQTAASVLADNRADIPFALIYLLDETQTQAQLIAYSGVSAESEIAAAAIDIAADTHWLLTEVLQTGDVAPVTPLADHFAHVPRGAWAEPPTSALVLPISAAGSGRAIGFFIVGISPRLALDYEYRNFYELVVGHIATAIGNARAFEEERKRAEALAALDRAKTEFFSNVSHEFRTPLTLLLNPLQEVLRGDEALAPHQRAGLEMSYRNSLRLLKLVNTLLDFSRIQSNRVRAYYQPTDLCQFTRDIASSFRSVVERGGLRLTVACTPDLEPVYVDREMWEKILLNLLSNAFKFTFEGQITVSLRAVDHAVEVAVQDTGVGIPDADIPHIFDRFHRVQSARSRSYEGSGIGLALVAQLVEYHGGTIRADSTPEVGTTFTITIPQSKAHLPPEQVGDSAPMLSSAIHADAYIGEAARWLSESDSPLDEIAPLYETSELILSKQSALTGRTILIVDDNTDMRDYLFHLLRPHYDVATAQDGLEALAHIHQQMPDLILSDMMMPNLDGFGLLRALRSDARTRTIPLILLSARAGEEARIEGLQAGADDYIVKPFSGRELLARLDAQLQLTRVRREAQAAIEKVIESIADPFYALDSDWRFVYVNGSAQTMWGKAREDLIGRDIWDVFPNGRETFAYAAMQRAIESRQPDRVETYSAYMKAWYEVNLYPTQDGLAVYFRNIDKRKQYEAALQSSAARDAFLVTLNDTLRPLRDPTAIQAEAARVLGSHLHANRVTYFEVLQDDYVVEQDYVDEAQPIKGRFPVASFGETLLAVYQSGQTAISSDVAAAAELSNDEKAAYAAIQIGAYIGVPLVKDGVFVAGLTAHSIQARLWTQDEVALVQETAERTWAAIERAKAELTLRETDERLQLAQQAGKVGVWDWDAATNTTYWADMMWTLYGLTPQPLSRKDDKDRIWERALHPDDAERVKAKIAQTLASDALEYRDEFRIVPPDGTTHWIESIARIERDAVGKPTRMFGINLDVTERKQSEIALRDAEERLRTIIDTAQDYAIFALDPQGRVTTWNAGAERIFAYREAEIIGEERTLLFTPEERATDAPQRELERATTIGYAENERWFVRKDGTRLYASGMIRTIQDERGTLQGFAKVVRDTTERKLAEQRAKIVQSVTAELSAQLGARDMAITVLRAVHDVIGEAVVSVFMLSQDGMSLERIASDDLTPEYEPQVMSVPLDLPIPLTEAARTKTAVWASSQADLVQRYPQIAAQIVENNFHASFCLPLLSEGNKCVGVFGITFTYPKVLTTDEWTTLTSIAYLCGQAFQRASLYSAEQQARRDANMRAERIARLQSITAKLSQTLTFDEAVYTVIDEAVTAADAITVTLNLLEDENTFALVHTSGIPSSPEEYAKWQRFPNNPALVVGAVAHRREPLFFESTADHADDYPAMSELMRRYAGASAALPLLIEDRVLGVITFVYKDRRSFSEEDRAFMGALVQQAAQAIERARLYEAEQQARREANVRAERIERLQTLTSKLSQGLTFNEVAQLLIDEGMAAMEATTGAFNLLEDSQTFAVVYRKGSKLSPEERADWERYPVSSDIPTGDVVLQKQPVWLESGQEMVNRYPTMTRIAEVYTGAWLALPLMIEERVLGVLGFSFDEARQFEAEERDFMMAIAQQGAQAIERAQLYEAEHQARAQATQRAERLSRLQVLTAKLSQLLTFDQVAKLMVDESMAAIGANTGALNMVEDDQTFSVVYRTGSKLSPEESAAWQRIPISDQLPAGDVVLRGEPLWFLSGEEMLRQYPATRPVAEVYTGAWVTLPLKIGRRVVGVLVFILDEPHVFDQEERAFMLAMAQQCAQAVQRTQLYEAEQQARRKAERQAYYILRLQTITAALSRALTPQNIGDLVIRDLMDHLGGHSGAVVLLNAGATEVEIMNQAGLTSQIYQQYSSIALEQNTPVTDVVRTGQPLWIETPEQYKAAYPQLWDLIQTTSRSQSIACVPLLKDEKIIGSLSLSFLTRHSFDEQEKVFLITVGQQCAQALERARLYESEQQARAEAEETAERIAWLQAMTAGLSEAVTMQQVAHVCVSQSTALLGAQMSNLVLLSDDGEWLETIESHGTPSDVAVYFQRMPLGGNSPLAQAVRTGQPVWVTSRAAFRDSYAELAGDIADILGNEAYANLPLTIEGRTFGAIGFAFATTKAFEAADRALMLALAQQCAQALERARLYEDEAQARQEAEEANALKMKFLGMISHELRTPLASIKGFSSTLLADDVTFAPEKQRQFLAVIDEQADKLTGLVEQLLDLSRLQAGTLRIEPTVQAFNTILDSAMTQLQMLTKAHELQAVLPVGLPNVMADRERVAQVLVNLVGNAAKFSPPDSTITLTVTQGDDHVKVSVSDQGVGIPAEERETIFEAFRQIERKDPNQRLGAGLGLAICKSIIEAHEGRIWVEDAAVGTTISFTLPPG